MAIIRGVSAAFHVQTPAASTATTAESMTRVGTSLWYKAPGAKINWDKDSTITVKDGGSAITTVQEINYSSGQVRLLTTPVGAVTADFSFFVVAEIGGCSKWDITYNMGMEESGTLGSAAKMPVPTVLDWKLSADKHWWDTRATLTTVLTGTNNDLVFTSKQGGDAGEQVSIEYMAGTSKTLGTTASGNVIVVQLGTDGGGAVTSTASAVMANVLACDDAMRLLDSVALAGVDTGAGVPTVMAHTHLAGGIPSDYLTTLMGAGDLIIRAYTDDGASMTRYEGIGYLSKVSETVKWDALIDQPLEITGHGPLYYVEG